MQDIKSYLIKYPIARERKSKDRFLATYINNMYKQNIDIDILTEMLKQYNSLDRQWRKILADSPELRGQDYNEKYSAEIKKLKELGYN